MKVQEAIKTLQRLAKAQGLESILGTTAQREHPLYNRASRLQLHECKCGGYILPEFIAQDGNSVVGIRYDQKSHKINCGTKCYHGITGTRACRSVI